MSGGVADGLGTIGWWGFTPAIDLQFGLPPRGKELIKTSEQHADELNILVIGASDCRHVLKTIAHSYRHPTRQLNFYVVELAPEQYARYMLLMAVALEPQARLGLQDKTELFLELHANTLIRGQCLEYVQRTANDFIRMVTDSDYLQQYFPLFDLSNLKFKERDLLEGVFKFWRKTDPASFNVEKCWELRLRHYLGTRYDAIPNVFDWDFHMKLCDKGAKIIHGQKYCRWRRTGIAYEIREATYNTSNRTLASIRLFNIAGDRSVRVGYWGDIVVSPYISLGIESEEKSFFKTSNNLYTKTSEQIAEFNVISMLHEILNHTHYQPPANSETPPKSTGPIIEEIDESVANDKKEEPKSNEPITVEIDNNLANDKIAGEETKSTGAITEEIAPESGHDIKEKVEPILSNEATVLVDRNKVNELLKPTVELGLEDKDERVHALDAPYKSSPLENAKIFLLPLNSAEELNKKEKYRKLFNIIYISNSLSHVLTRELSETFSDSALVIMDTAKFLLELNKDQSTEFVRRIVNVAESIGCKLIGELDENNDSFVRFQYNNPPSVTS